MAVLGGLTLLALGLCSIPAEAAKLAFRNDGPTPVIVQGTCLVKGSVVRGKPLLINPGQTANWDRMPAGTASVTVQDGRLPARTLYQGSIVVDTDDLYYAVQPDPPGPKAKIKVLDVAIPK
jgi:hypothetical protein